MDEALQAPNGDVGFVPWVHYDGGSSTEKKAAASLTVAAAWAQEARAIGGGGFRREGKGAKYGTLAANPVVL